jgi:hypothetical protein
LSSCLDFIKQNCPGEYAWVDTNRAFCDPVNDDNYAEPFAAVPLGHLHRAALRRNSRHWQQTVPRYLFRGESAFFENTWTSLWRMMNNSDFEQSERGMILSAMRSVKDRLCGSSGTKRIMSPPFAEGCCQHYGLPTTLVDFTSNLDVAASFAAPTGGVWKGLGAIGVLDVQGAQCGTKEMKLSLVDLTRHPWTPRPRNQAAYGIRHIDFFGAGDYKDAECCSDLGLTWYLFDHAGDEQEWGGRTNDLLEASADVMAGLIFMFLDEFAKLHGPLPKKVAEWLGLSCALYTAS